jgi:outer membrane protease
MKNIPGIFSFVCILALVFLAPPLPAKPLEPPEGTEFPYVFAAGLSGGILYGQAREMLYKYADTDDYLSQLLWDMKPLAYAGMGLSFSPREPWKKAGFFTELSFRAGIPGATGSMEDRDWLNTENEMLTHYSRHDNYTRGAFLLDYILGFSFPLGDRVRTRWYGAFSMMVFNWEARDGYLQYTENDPLADPPSRYPWTDSIPKTYIYGRGITYYQQWFTGSPGMSLHLSLSDRLSLGFYIQMGPLIFCGAQDDHLSEQFIDIVSGGLLTEPRAELVFSPSPGWDLVFYVSCRQITRTRGDSYSRKSLFYNEATQQILPATDERFLQSTYSSGAGFMVLDAGFSAKRNL